MQQLIVENLYDANIKLYNENVDLQEIIRHCYAYDPNWEHDLPTHLVETLNKTIGDE